MQIEDAEEYTQSAGQVMAGGWRLILLAQRLGVPEALGLTTREWVVDRLGGYIRMAVPERRAAVVELLAEGLTTREAADVLGVGQSTIMRDVAEPNGSPAAIPTPTFEPNGSEPPPLPRPEPTHTWILPGTCPYCAHETLLQVTYWPAPIDRNGNEGFCRAFWIPPHKFGQDWFPDDDDGDPFANEPEGIELTERL